MESRIVRLELGDLVRLADCPPGLFEYNGALCVKHGDLQFALNRLHEAPLYGRDLVRPVRIVYSLAVQVEGEVE